MTKVLDLDNPETAKRLEETVKQVREELRPWTDPIRRGAILTAEDYMIRFNTYN